MSAAEKLEEIFTNTTRAEDWTEVYEVVRWIQLVMALLSTLGSGSIIACVMSQRLGRTPELQPLFLLSASDLLLAVCWLIGAALFSQHCSSLNSHCHHLHTVEQVLYMTSFFYTLNYIWDLYTRTREKFYSCMNGYPVQSEYRRQNHGAALRSVSCSADDTSVHTRKHQPMSSQLQRALQVSADAHRSIVPDLTAPAANQQSLQPAAHLQHLCLPHHLLHHTHRHHGAHGKSPSYLPACCDIKWLPRQPAAGHLPCVGPADAAVPDDLRALLGSSGRSGVYAAGDALRRSGRGRGRPLRVAGFHLGLSGFPQLSGLWMDTWTSPQSRWDSFISRRGHSDTAAEITEEEQLPESVLHLLRCQSQLSLSLRGKTPRLRLCRGRRRPPRILNH